MYRIDENTYIDDSLVTYAEYQLFIDEMREQGQYFQPDHWTSYQFPAGQARAPIVGIRQSDAKTFCEWLTKREAGEWRYRLPRFEEAKGYPLRPSKRSPLGYWLDGEDGNTRFTWVGAVPANPHGLKHAIALPNNLANTHDLPRARDLARDIDIALTRARDLALALARDRALNRALTLARTLTHTLARDLAHASANDLVHASARALDLDRDRDLARDLNIDRDIEFALDIFIDIFTLRERSETEL